ncbi:Hypothetical predicted protein [Mytilus galloprovincialis]|uniref:Uncharacterized protein n=3 Tax=Mytilus TaxID=6548 RepID=A0A8B6ELC7_MYTGA|nr:Hypothetical predicted protein [Mytilus galloprovincialis]
MMDSHDDVLTALPSYVRYSRRELGKLSKEDRRESAFSGIRQKLSSAVISVPYGGGLDNLRLIGNLDDHEFQNRFTSYTKPRRKKNKNGVVSDTEMFMSDGEMSPTKGYHRYHDQFSPSKFILPSRKPARIGSETSTTSTATTKSRSTIYSTTSEHDEGYWAKKLKELDEVKERYSDNSEFLTHLYACKLKKDKHSKKKKNKKVKRDDESTPQSIAGDISNRLVLPPIKQKPIFDRKSRESTLTNPSDESNTSTIVANDENEVSKRRKVEFNLHQKAKRTVKLPPLESKHEYNRTSPRVKNPKRSILKKMDKNTDTVVNSFPAKTHSTSSVYNNHIGKLKSPIPSSASRRQQVTFKRNPFNLKYKCSKEFEAVASNYEKENERKPSFMTD